MWPFRRRTKEAPKSNHAWVEGQCIVIALGDMYIAQRHGHQREDMDQRRQHQDRPGSRQVEFLPLHRPVRASFAAR